MFIDINRFDQANFGAALLEYLTWWLELRDKNGLIIIYGFMGMANARTSSLMITIPISGIYGWGYTIKAP